MLGGGQVRTRGGRARSACFGLVEADDEEAASSAVEQRYLKVGYKAFCYNLLLQFDNRFLARPQA